MYIQKYEILNLNFTRAPCVSKHQGEMMKTITVFAHMVQGARR